MDKELIKLQEMAGIMVTREKPTTIAIPEQNLEEELDEVLDEFEEVVDEEVIGDLNNGYDEHHKTTKHHHDYFPSGATSPITKTSSHAAAKHGDSPLYKGDGKEYQKVHEELVYKYREFVAETPSGIPVDPGSPIKSKKKKSKRVKNVRRNKNVNNSAGEKYWGKE